MSEPIARLAKAVHTLFFASMEANERRKWLRTNITTDDELAAFQTLDMALINYDAEPLSEKAREALAARVREWDQEIANPPTVSPRIMIEAGSGEEGAYFKRLLEHMYARWDGTLDYERGTHRLSFYSPFDEQGRRHTTFARVYVDGMTSDVRCRNYILGPYLRVVDFRTQKESDDPWRVLGGDLLPLLPTAQTGLGKDFDMDNGG